MEGELLGGDLVTFLPWLLSPNSREKRNDPSPEVTDRKASGAIGLTLSFTDWVPAEVRAA